MSRKKQKWVYVIDMIEENALILAHINDMIGEKLISRRIAKFCKNKTRKKREELSVSATKSIKKEKVEIVVKFD